MRVVNKLNEKPGSIFKIVLWTDKIIVIMDGGKRLEYERKEGEHGSKKEAIREALHAAVLEALTPKKPVDLFKLLETRKRERKPAILLFFARDPTRTPVDPK
jgi:hypothetical protein